MSTTDPSRGEAHIERNPDFQLSIDQIGIQLARLVVPVNPNKGFSQGHVGFILRTALQEKKVDYRRRETQHPSSNISNSKMMLEAFLKEKNDSRAHKRRHEHTCAHTHTYAPNKNIHTFPIAHILPNARSPSVKMFTSSPRL